MTTLHEEPSTRHQTLTEEMEENYSDSELNQFHDDSISTKPPLRSRFPTSKTMGSLREIGGSFQSITSSTNITNNSVKNMRKSSITNNTNIGKQTITGTPSMTSSTSSGYGSQVKYDNLNSKNFFFFFFQYFILTTNEK